jgi:hypothetical protein
MAELVRLAASLGMLHTARTPRPDQAQQPELPQLPSEE